MKRRSIAILLSGALLAACHTLAPGAYGPGFSETGLASWYGADFHQKRTANGERFDMNGLTAAHRSLPFDSYVRVTNVANGRSVVVRINDRGPFIADRIIDLSAKAARQLGIKEDGVARVRIEVVKSSEARI
jgi:rare lipoprotein A